MKTWMRASVIAGGLMAAPLTYDAAEVTVKANDASCMATGGTCCSEKTSTCYPNNCQSVLCSQNDAYWKAEGSCLDEDPT